MATTIGHLAVVVSANTAGMVGGLAAAGKSVNSFVGTIGRMVGVTSVFAGLGMAAKTMFAGFAGDQKAQIAFGALLGSAERAKELVDELEVAGNKTTFADAFMEAGKELLKFNVDANKVAPTLSRLAEISAALDVPLTDLAQTFGEVSYRGSLTSKQLISLTKQGVPLVQELMKTLGVSQEVVLSMVENGEVGFKQFEAAIRSATGAGGRFYDSVNKQNNSVEGFGRIWQNMVKVVEEFGETAGQALSKASGLGNVLGGIGDWFGSIAAGMGSLKTGLTQVFGVIGMLPTVFSVAFEESKLFLGSFVKDVIHAFTVTIPEVFTWFTDNWRVMLNNISNLVSKFIGDQIATFAQLNPNIPQGMKDAMNIAKNARVDMAKVEPLELTKRGETDWEKGVKDRIGGLKADLARGLAEAVANPELGRAMAEAWNIDDLVDAIFKDIYGTGKKSMGEVGDKAKDTGPKFAGAFEAGSKEAYNLILANRQMSLQPMERTAKASEETAKHSARMAGDLDHIADVIDDRSEYAPADLG